MAAASTTRTILRVGPKNSLNRVIFGHGLGDTPHGWADVCHYWSKKLPHVEFILPQAPTIPVSLNHGMEMPAWYDIDLPNRASEEDGAVNARLALAAPGIEDAVKTYMKEVLDPTRTVLAGFSQGAGVAMYTGICHDLGVINAKKNQHEEAKDGNTDSSSNVEKTDDAESEKKLLENLQNKSNSQLNGILCMSGYLPKAMKVLQTFERLKTDDSERAKIIANENKKRRKTPVLMCHGMVDPMVDIHAARATKEFVTQNFASQFDLKLETFERMAHEACQEEVDLIAEWLAERFPDTTAKL